MIKTSMSRRQLILIGGLAAAALWFAAAPAAARSSAYADLDDGAYLPQIEELAAAGILEGTECAPAAFCPDEPATRGAVAVWLVRALEGDEPPTAGRTRFSDVTGRWVGYIERLAELGITSGCGERERFCPDGHVSRRHLAVFLVRAYGLTPAVVGEVFADVAEGDWTSGHIETAVSVGLMEACSLDGKLYCPDELVTRAEAAAALAQARQKQRLFEPPVDGPRQVYAGRRRPDSLWIQWRQPWHKGYLPLTKYVVQWRPAGEEFDEIRQAEVADIDRLWHIVDGVDGQSLYEIRIMAVNAAGAGPLSAPAQELSSAGRPLVLSDTAPNLFDEAEDIEWPRAQRLRFWLYVEEELLPRYEQEHPWLRQAWNRVKTKGSLDFCQRHDCDDLGSGAVSFFCRADKPVSSLPRCWLRELILKADKLKDDSLIVHELGHVLTLDNVFLEESLELTLAGLYFVDLADEACPAHELYADTLEALVVGPGSGWYWQRCSHLPDSPSRKALAVVGQALAGEDPGWFNRKYGLPDSSLDYQAIWADIARLSERPWTAVVHSLRQHFGGYCDEAALAAALRTVEDKAELGRRAQPWRDGGCQPEPS